MSYNLLWIFLLISHDFVASLPVRHQYGSSGPVPDQQSTNNGLRLSNYDSTNQQVISVSVTSSVAVGRGKTKTNYRPHPTPPDINKSIPPVTPWNPHFTTQIPFSDANSQQPTTYAPPRLLGANIEYLKQLNAKKDYDTNGEHSFQVKSTYTDNYEISHTDNNYEHQDYIKDLPQARKVPSTSNVNMFHERNRFYHNAGVKLPTDTDRLFTHNYARNMTSHFSFSSPAVGPLNNMHPEKNFTLPSFTSNANFQGITRANNMDVNHFFSTETYHTRDSVAEASAKTLEYAKSNTNNGNIQASHSAHSLNYDQDINRGRNTPPISTPHFNIPQPGKRPSSNVFQDMSEVYQNTSPEMSSKLYSHSNPSNITNDPIFGNSMLGSRMLVNNNKTIKPIYTQELEYGTVTNTNEMTNMYDFFTTETYQTDDSIPEASIKSVDYAETNINVGNVLPTVPPPRAAHSPNYAQGLHNKRVNQEINHPRLTTVSFNVLHDTSTVNMRPTNNMGSSGSYMSPSQMTSNHFSEPSKIYSQPSQIYSEPSKYYSEPAKVYSEPSKIYSEPSKVYGEPSKIYSEPSKFYSEPASLHLDHSVPHHRSTHGPQGSYSPWQQTQQPTGNTIINTTPLTTITNSYQTGSTQTEHQPEKNYEVDEKESVLTDGRSHGVQESNTEKCKQDNCKVGYVVEGRQFKKYRVEERTSDGFIVGEYGVVRNEDGDLRGVRYTADSDASPGLIHDALMKFLQL